MPEVKEVIRTGILLTSCSPEWAAMVIDEPYTSHRWRPSIGRTWKNATPEIISDTTKQEKHSWVRHTFLQMFLTCSLWKLRLFEGAAKHPHAEQNHHRCLASSGSLSEDRFLDSKTHFVAEICWNLKDKVDACTQKPESRCCVWAISRTRKTMTGFWEQMFSLPFLTALYIIICAARGSAFWLCRASVLWDSGCRPSPQMDDEICFQDTKP